MRAPGILETARDTIAQRGVDYDVPGGERSMARAVEIFNAATGGCMTEHEGWMFMVALKMSRISSSPTKLDNYVDGAAYFALAAETSAT